MGKWVGIEEISGADVEAADWLRNERSYIIRKCLQMIMSKP